MKKYVLLGIIFLLLGQVKAFPFFLTVIQQKGKGFGLKGQELTWLVFRSEPFSGIIYDLKAPKGRAFLPDGKTRPLALRRTKIFDFATGKKHFAFKGLFLPEKEGDYFLVFETEPTLAPGVGEVWQEWVKIPLHVGLGQGWDKPLGLKVEIVPLTQPYGLEAGMTFRGRLYLDGKPLPRALIQLVPFHGRYLSPDKLPHNAWKRRENARMYFSIFTDENGLFSVSFSKKGWWLLSARIPYGRYKIGLLTYPFFLRASFWLYVFPPYLPPEEAPQLNGKTNE